MRKPIALLLLLAMSGCTAMNRYDCTHDPLIAQAAGHTIVEGTPDYDICMAHMSDIRLQSIALSAQAYAESQKPKSVVRCVTTGNVQTCSVYGN